jgi:transaldolase/glucose-6-phosphate isomerase
MNLKAVHDLGQSIWLDYMRRHLVHSGQLAGLVEQGLCGVTSNPSIFEKAIAGSTDYSAAIASIADRSATEIYEQLAIEDIQAAADVLRPVYDKSSGGDGFVSLEVSPLLARDTARTIDEARRLWTRVARDNLMITVPATPEGIPAIRELISNGINVNVTLLFSRDVFAQVAEAYADGLETLAARGGDLSRIASVASFFVSRIDVAIDRVLERRKDAAALLGKTAIANARLAYQDWKQRLGSSRWRALAARGARAQRVLWASTSTKDPRLPDVYYVEALIGRDTVDTVPPATLDAFIDHGRASATLEADLDQARAVIDVLPNYGVDLSEVTARLTVEGVDAFRASFEQLIAAVEAKRRTLVRPDVERITRALSPADEVAVEATLADWEAGDKVRRLWSRDASLWTGKDESKRLAWLTIADREQSDEASLHEFAAEVKQRGFRFVAVLGMGGSSLCPDVLARTFGPQPGYPELRILDSTDPAQIRTFEAGLDLARTLFIVSSKSGTTLEPNVLADYFYERVRSLVGDGGAGEQFVVITDPDRPYLQEVAAARNYWKVFFGEPGIGGRYSALSRFGLVPAAAMGLDVSAFLDRTQEMVDACEACVPVRDNPGVVLGAVLGTLAHGGRDKITLVSSPAVVHLGAWIEQLLAESTGKQGRGLIPIDREPLGPPEVYGQDRLFVYVRFEPEPDPAQDAAIASLKRSAQPVITIELTALRDLGQMFFLWEMATAVAGSILEIDPFDQPDVEASKVEARKLTDEYERTGAFAPETPLCREGPLALFADADTKAALKGRVDGDVSLRAYLRAHLESLEPGDYFATLAYVENAEPQRRALDGIRRVVRDRRHVATCVEFGPRFLHSTGQVYKGGPNTGVFLQLTCDAARDLPVPGKRYTLGVVEAAQARGDFEVLTQRKRRALRVDLGSDVDAGLHALASAVTDALG